MFVKVKLFLVCALVALGASACSSDDSTTSSTKKGTGYRVSNEDYVVEVKGTKNVDLQRIEVSLIEGKDITTFVKDSFGGKREWTKEFKKTVKQKITVAVNAEGPEEEVSVVTIRVKKDKNIIKDIEFKGEKIYGEVVF
ncbi:hypothetical protein [Myroides sp. DW712]|uniref:hypothetical protein n=1 Tax=Myroides sp. DW712 TaxID=3389800 RepID=UPI00397B6ECB